MTALPTSRKLPWTLVHASQGTKAVSTVWEWILLVFSVVLAGDSRETMMGKLSGSWQVWSKPGLGEGDLMNLAVRNSELLAGLPLAVGLEVGVSPWVALFCG